MNPSNRPFLLVCLAACCAIAAAEEPAKQTLPPWALGPFVRPADAQPVIRPNPDSVFDCPMNKKPVHWEARHTFRRKPRNQRTPTPTPTAPSSG